MLSASKLALAPPSTAPTEALQILELAELNAVHEHGIFYDCVRSETVPLDRQRTRDFSFRTSKRCSYKFDATSTRAIRLALEGDLTAVESLLHRFLRECAPQRRPLSGACERRARHNAPLCSAAQGGDLLLRFHVHVSEEARRMHVDASLLQLCDHVGRRRRVLAVLCAKRRAARRQRRDSE